MGLDIYLAKGKYSEDLGYDPDYIKKPSNLHPEHYWKIGYFRSSYNASGINAKMRARELPNLYDIFLPPEGKYTFVPDWTACLARADTARASLKRYANSGVGQYDAYGINLYGAAASIGEAIDTFVEQKQKDNTFRSFSSTKGDFFLDGINIVAVIKAKHDRPFGPNLYLVVKDPNALTTCLEAFDIVIETCEFVLEQPDPDEYYLIWSA